MAEAEQKPQDPAFEDEDKEKLKKKGKEKIGDDSSSSSDDEKDGKEGATVKFLYDLYEQEKFLVAVLELPGFKQEDIEVSYDGEKEITIEGERGRKEGWDGKIKKKHEMLRKFGKVKQTLKVPDGVEVQKNFIEALYKNGLLKIKLKLKKKDEKKRTTIQVAYKHQKRDGGDDKKGKDGDHKDKDHDNEEKHD